MWHAGSLHFVPEVTKVTLDAALSTCERLVLPAVHLGAVVHAGLFTPRAADSTEWLRNFVQLVALVTGSAHVPFALCAVVRTLRRRRRLAVARLTVVQLMSKSESVTQSTTLMATLLCKVHYQEP